MAEVTEIKPVEDIVEIINPQTGGPLGVRVSIMSIDDPRMKAIKRQVTDERLHLESRGKHFKSDDIEENSSKLLFKAITGWEWYNPTGAAGDPGFDADEHPTLDGEKQPAFNRVNVLRFMTVATWFKDQINEAVGDSARFFKVSKSN